MRQRVKKLWWVLHANANSRREQSARERCIYCSRDQEMDGSWLAHVPLYASKILQYVLHIPTRSLPQAWHGEWVRQTCSPPPVIINLTGSPVINAARRRDKDSLVFALRVNKNNSRKRTHALGLHSSVWSLCDFYTENLFIHWASLEFGSSSC